MKCLLVDDEPGIREGLAALLRRKGHEVHTAGDCDAAGAALLEQSFDLVITDWRLPDGTAGRFLVGCPCPVVTVSGHPEEVQAYPAIREVLTKPVTPARLLAVLASVVSDTIPVPKGVLPLDVHRIVTAVQARLPASAADLHDDGTFLLLTAELPDDTDVPFFATLGGDLRVLSRRGRLWLELRLCRDGRPEADLLVVKPDASWPDAERFAVDFHGSEISAEHFASCLDLVRHHRTMGRTVHFLNVSDRLRSLATDWGRAHDMPMREMVGPRLPAVFADLWSQP